MISNMCNEKKILSRYLRLWFALVHLRIVKLNILGGWHVQYIPPGKKISHLVGTKSKKESTDADFTSSNSKPHPVLR